ncbi:hypothetical protein OEA41_003033 [Lepraria neglecta]|uniref:Large ribosomal subunit protein bL17m n=1 Tax=Lepraria neglecta TaxID=209136 RepID=A0AAE0DII9_9LECA|nr:hypothetical protein OEA41_003033 [Lepraria neglecta]
MAGGHLKYRHLSRDSAHRQSLLRNLVTSLITHESIRTTWPKAKEAQRLAEKLITLGKKNTNASRNRAEQIFFQPWDHLPKLFGELRRRYIDRPGGYTRVLRTEPLNRHDDQAPSAILELVDGPRDMRFAMTAKSIAHERSSGVGLRDITARNVAKVTRYRKNGAKELERLVKSMGTWRRGNREGYEMRETGKEMEERKRGWAEKRGEVWERRHPHGERDPNSGRRRGGEDDDD